MVKLKGGPEPKSNILLRIHWRVKIVHIHRQSILGGVWVLVVLVHVWRVSARQVRQIQIAASHQFLPPVVEIFTQPRFWREQAVFNSESARSRAIHPKQAVQSIAAHTGERGGMTRQRERACGGRETCHRHKTERPSSSKRQGCCESYITVSDITEIESTEQHIHDCMLYNLKESDLEFPG